MTFQAFIETVSRDAGVRLDGSAQLLRDVCGVYGYQASSPDGVYEYDLDSGFWSYSYHRGDGTTGDSRSLEIAKQIAGLQ